jgi:hypothetical protein
MRDLDAVAERVHRKETRPSEYGSRVEAGNACPLEGGTRDRDIVDGHTEVTAMVRLRLTGTDCVHMNFIAAPLEPGEIKRSQRLGSWDVYRSHDSLVKVHRLLVGRFTARAWHADMLNTSVRHWYFLSYLGTIVGNWRLPATLRVDK